MTNNANTSSRNESQQNSPIGKTNLLRDRVVSVLNEVGKPFLITSAIACASAILGIIVFLYQNAVMQSWNISVGSISDTYSRRILYYVLFTFAYSFSVLLAIILSRTVLTKFSSLALLAFSTRRPFEVIRRHIRCQRKELKRLKKREVVNKYTIRIEELMKCREKDKKDIKDIKRKINSLLRRTMFKVLLVCLILMSLILLPSCFLTATIAGTVANFDIVLLSMCISMAIIFISALSQSVFTIPQKIKDIRNESKTLATGDTNTAFLVLREITDSIPTLLQCKTIKQIVEKISTSLNMSDLICLIVNLIGTGIMIISVAYLTPITQKEYWLYTTPNNELYVVVYSNENTLVLKQAEEIDNGIRIFLNTQSLTDARDKKMAYKKFEKVELISDS